MRFAITVGQGLFELCGVVGFLAGYFFDIRWLMLAGGSFVVLDDPIEIAFGVLNPLFPVLFAVALAIIFTPWYVGVFWASAVFKIWNIRISLRKVRTPQRFLFDG